MNEIAVLTDITADEYESARAQLHRADLIKRRAIRALQKAEQSVDRELGEALTGVRSNGRVVVRVEHSHVEARTIEAHPRRDLRPGKANERIELGVKS